MRNGLATDATELSAKVTVRGPRDFLAEIRHPDGRVAMKCAYVTFEKADAAVKRFVRSYPLPQPKPGAARKLFGL